MLKKLDTKPISSDTIKYDLINQTNYKSINTVSMRFLTITNFTAREMKIISVTNLLKSLVNDKEEELV